jgi:hypothetical protein
MSGLKDTTLMNRMQSAPAPFQKFANFKRRVAVAVQAGAFFALRQQTAVRLFDAWRERILVQ